MKEYHKIHSVFMRDAAVKGHPLIVGQFALPEFEYLQNNKWEFTEKVDGTNIRVMLEPDSKTGWELRGKTDNAQIPAKLTDRLRQLFDPMSQLLREMCPEGVCLYGEGYGPGIQKGGGNYGAIPDFVLFDVRIGPWWLKRADVDDFANKLGLRSVPVIGHGTLWDMAGMVCDRFDSQWGAFTAEGIVARPAVDLLARSGSRIITKLKCRDFPDD